MMESLIAPFQRLSEKMDSLQRELNEVYGVFVFIKNIVAAIFGFLGQETSILLFCTFLFILVLNLFPFLFFGKNARYYAGTAFGTWLGIKLGYGFLATGKFLLVMFSPILLELGIGFIVKKAGSLLLRAVKKLWSFLWSRLRSKFGKKKDESS